MAAMGALFSRCGFPFGWCVEQRGKEGGFGRDGHQARGVLTVALVPSFLSFRHSFPGPWRPPGVRKAALSLDSHLYVVAHAVRRALHMHQPFLTSVALLGLQDDAVGLYMHALESSRVYGAMNAVGCVASRLGQRAVGVPWSIEGSLVLTPSCWPPAGRARDHLQRRFHQGACGVSASAGGDSSARVCPESGPGLGARQRAAGRTGASSEGVGQGWTEHKAAFSPCRRVASPESHARSCRQVGLRI